MVVVEGLSHAGVITTSSLQFHGEIPPVVAILLDSMALSKSKFKSHTISLYIV
jgi:hypothetical protein